MKISFHTSLPIKILTRQSGRIFRLGLEVCGASLSERRYHDAVPRLRQDLLNSQHTPNTDQLAVKGGTVNTPFLRRTQVSKSIHFAPCTRGLISLSHFYLFVFYMHYSNITTSPLSAYFNSYFILNGPAYPVVHWLNFILF